MGYKQISSSSSLHLRGVCKAVQTNMADIYEESSYYFSDCISVAHSNIDCEQSLSFIILMSSAREGFQEQKPTTRSLIPIFMRKVVAQKNIRNTKHRVGLSHQRKCKNHAVRERIHLRNGLRNRSL